jgi:hypothetical protein
MNLHRREDLMSHTFQLVLLQFPEQPSGCEGKVLTAQIRLQNMFADTQCVPLGAVDQRTLNRIEVLSYSGGISSSVGLKS